MLYHALEVVFLLSLSGACGWMLFRGIPEIRRDRKRIEKETRRIVAGTERTKAEIRELERRLGIKQEKQGPLAM